MKVTDLDRLNYFDMLILRSLVLTGKVATAKDLISQIKVFVERYGIVPLKSRQKVYFYRRLDFLESLGLVSSSRDVIKCWQIRDLYKSRIDVFTEAYFRMLDVRGDRE